MKNAHILIVEDEVIVALDIKKHLQKMGYKVCGPVSSGEKAIDLIKKEGPDLVLMDIHLQGEMDGIETTKKISSEFGIPVVYLTAHGDEATFEKATKTRPYGYIIKPFSQDDLRSAIEIALLHHPRAREREEWQSAILMNIGDAIITTDENGRVTFINPAAETLLGWALPEALGKPISEVCYITNEGVNKTSQMQKSDATVAISTHTTKTILSRNGKTIPVDDTTTSIKDEKGNSRGIIKVLKDMSEWKKSEYTIRKQNFEMKTAMRQLKNREEQLLQSAKMAAVGQMIANVAHEVNNPLMAISGYAQLLLDEIEDESHRKDLMAINSEAERTMIIVKDLLLFTRKHDQEKSPLSINKAVGKIVNIYSRELKLDNIEMECNLSPDLPEVMANDNQIRQVFVNLINNAWHAMKESEGNRKLYIETKHEGQTVIITFTDTGPGLPVSGTARIFEPFFTTKDQGTGLGLSICYSIISDHQGQIYAGEASDQGATFFIKLPAIRTEATVAN